jgi:GST-like protein
LATDVRKRAATMQWLMFQMSHVGPIIGQTGHFLQQAPEKIPYAIQRFVNESVRIVTVLDQGLKGRDHLAGDYSIADIATYPWVVAAWGPFKQMMPEKIGELGNVQAWIDRMAARPAVERGMAIPKV